MPDPVANAAPAASDAPANGGAAPAAPAAAAGAQAAPASPAATPAAPAAPAQLTAADLTVPQGFDPKGAEQILGLAGKLGWDKAAAQKYLDHVAAELPARQAAAEQARAQEIAGWEASIKADPTFGGQRFDATIADAKHALATMQKQGTLTAADLQMLEQTGLGSHPIAIKLAALAGRAMREDRFGGGNAGGKSDEVSAVDLYPSMRKAAG